MLGILFLRLYEALDDEENEICLIPENGIGSDEESRDEEKCDINHLPGSVLKCEIEKDRNDGDEEPESSVASARKRKKTDEKCFTLELVLKI